MKSRHLPVTYVLYPEEGHGLAIPENRISFAYVMNQMEPGVLPGPKSLRLIDALYSTIAEKKR